MADENAMPVAEAPAKKTRQPTTPFTWACTAVFAVVAVVGGYFWYVTLGPGRTVDTSGIREGMNRMDVYEALGNPDEIFTVNGKTALRYGRTHVWIRGMPGRGDAVVEVTDGPGGQ
jgi:hypothetical protein